MSDPPQIVVLDGHTLNPGDLSWSPLEAIGSVTVFDRTPPSEVVPRVGSAPLVLTNKVVLDRAAMTQLPELQYVGVLATGFNNIDLEAAKERGITVTNAPSYSTDSVAQFVFAHLLNFACSVSDYGKSVAVGDWQRSPDFCYWNRPSIELAGKSIGIVGFGQIGKATASLAQAFGMQVFAHSRRPPSAAGVQAVDLNTLLGESDFVSLHCPLTPETHHLINAETLARMKPTAYLINTGRGPLVDEEALAAALGNGTIAGAGLDVLTSEPPRDGSPLIGARNCVITPHLAWSTREARTRLMRIVADNLRSFLSGSPANVVT